MKLCTFLHEGRARAGVVQGDKVADLGISMLDLLAAGPAGTARAAETHAPLFALKDVTLKAPVPSPGKVMGLGANYRAHVREMGREMPEHQLWFNKQRTCIVGPGEPIRLPRVSDKVDYEGELAVVIGRRCRNVPAARAHEVIAGYTVGNDVSARDWQRRTPTMTLGKSFDSHGPTGPFLVTPDEAGDPQALTLRTWVSGELRQDASTSDMIFPIPEQIALLTTVFTLEPGDVLFTGTPSGVGMGFDPPRFLKAGDTVRIEIGGIGTLENPVIADDTGTVIG